MTGNVKIVRINIQEGSSRDNENIQEGLSRNNESQKTYSEILQDNNYKKEEDQQKEENQQKYEREGNQSQRYEQQNQKEQPEERSTRDGTNTTKIPFEQVYEVIGGFTQARRGNKEGIVKRKAQGNCTRCKEYHGENMRMFLNRMMCKNCFYNEGLKQYDIVKKEYDEAIELCRKYRIDFYKTNNFKEEIAKQKKQRWEMAMQRRQGYRQEYSNYQGYKRY